jgi:hypothetical protein
VFSGFALENPMTNPTLSVQGIKLECFSGWQPTDFFKHMQKHPNESMTSMMLQAVGKPHQVLRLAIVESRFVDAAKKRHVAFVAHGSPSGKCVLQLRI